MRNNLFVFLFIVTAFAGPARPSDAVAQSNADCGIVTAIDYPLEINDTFTRSFDDFGRFRRRFDGLHTGIDLAFQRHLEPVRAAADGRVTYADPEGWDTELGVVIIRHDFPDGSVYYSLYGHMEESVTVRFPTVGACVRRGDVIGLIGDPSLSAPHLHYEIRDFMPNDGGPGYVQVNPRLQGWFHPLDFTDQWRIRLGTGYLGSVTLDSAPDVPPVMLDTGVIVAATGPTVRALSLPDTSLWQITGTADVTGIVALPGGQVASVTKAGAVSVFADGRYAARWQVTPPPVAPVELAGALVMPGGDRLTAYDMAGQTLWQTDALYNTPQQVIALTANETTVALTTRVRGRYLWRLLDAAGNVLFERSLARPPVAATGPGASWTLLDGTELLRVDGATSRGIGSIDQTHGSGARMTVDALGNSTIYLDDDASTFLSVSATGELRWQATYPLLNAPEPPLVAAGSVCMLATLDSDGVLNLFDANTGQLAQQLFLYAGGTSTARPDARLLRADTSDRLLVGAGFHSIVLLDGAALMARSAATCEQGQP